MGQITKITNGESGAAVANKLWATEEFDYVIENTADWDALANRTYSGTITNILIRGEISVTKGISGTSYNSPNVVFMKGAKIVSSGSDIVLDGFNTVVNGNIELTSISLGADCYSYISNLYHCVGKIISNTNSAGVTVFDYCKNLINPLAIVDFNSGNSGGDPAFYDNCDSLVQPKYSNVGFLTDSPIYSDCTNIICPQISGTSIDYNGTCTGVSAVALV